MIEIAGRKRILPAFCKVGSEKLSYRVKVPF